MLTDIYSYYPAEFMCINSAIKSIRTNITSVVCTPLISVITLHSHVILTTTVKNKNIKSYRK